MTRDQTIAVIEFMDEHDPADITVVDAYNTSCGHHKNYAYGPWVLQVYDNGAMAWYKDGKPFRCDDKPTAIVLHHGDMVACRQGEDGGIESFVLL